MSYQDNSFAIVKELKTTQSESVTTLPIHNNLKQLLTEYQVKPPAVNKETLNFITTKHKNLFDALHFFRKTRIELTHIKQSEIFKWRPDPYFKNLPEITYVYIFDDTLLNTDAVINIRNQVKKIDAQACAVLVVTKTTPSISGWKQIGAFRVEQTAFNIIPFEMSAMKQAIAESNERSTLKIAISRHLKPRYGTEDDPYKYTKPVSDKFRFFGHASLIHQLVQEMRHGQPVAIFGFRKIGKSSLLHKLQKELSFPTALINLQTDTDSNYIASCYQRIVDNWAKWLSVKHKIDWTPFIIDRNDPKKSLINATNSLLRLLEYKKVDARLGILLDEVEEIVPLSTGGGPDLKRYLDIVQTIRGIIDEGVQLSIAVASLNASINRITSWDNQQNPTFSFFKEFFVSPLEKEDCFQMIENIGAQFMLFYDKDCLQKIFEWSGGHPFLARRLASQLYQTHVGKMAVINEKDLNKIIENFFDDNDDYLNGMWQDIQRNELWFPYKPEYNCQLLIELASSVQPIHEKKLIKDVASHERRKTMINLSSYHIIRKKAPQSFEIGFQLFKQWILRRVIKTDVQPQTL
jgi:hypothetical protein